MTITPIGHSGRQIVNQADRQVTQAGQQLASLATKSNTSEVTATDALVALQQGEAYSKVGARVIEAEDATLGSLLDISV